MYLTGRMYGRASIMRFYKNSARLDWYLKFEELTYIRAWAQVPLDRHVYACGEWETTDAEADIDEAETKAAVMRLRNDGTVLWYSTFSGTNPETGNSKANMDRCFGLSYDHNNNEVSILLQSKATELRSS
jgi:hypothetical protein